MTLTVREVDVRASRAELVFLLARHFAEWRKGAEAKFEWLYLDNPFGLARVWALENGSRGFVGLSAAFPRRMMTRSRTFEAWVLGDFCVDRELRTLGPALMLQRAVCDAVDGKDCDAWYDFPSRSMMALYRRMNLAPAGEMIRLVCPLRVDEAVARTLDSSAFARGVSVIGNMVLRTRDALRRRNSSVEVRPFAEALGASSGSWPTAPASVRLDRTPEYLDWRYRRDPRGGNSILAAWRDGMCGGFLVFRADSKRYAIVDAFGVREEAFLRELVKDVIDRARRDGASRVNVGLTDGHPWLHLFEGWGFRQREKVPFVVYTRPGTAGFEAPWLLTNGDRDI